MVQFAEASNFAKAQLSPATPTRINRDTLKGLWFSFVTVNVPDS